MKVKKTLIFPGLTQKESRHAKRIFRVLNDAKRKLLELSNHASANDTYPKTTLKAYIEVTEALQRAELRIVAHDASVV